MAAIIAKLFPNCRRRVGAGCGEENRKIPCGRKKRGGCKAA
ncbi:MAG: hypothetical protein ACLS4Z_08380 [Christensenellaceae bacterium]